jgi:hypothetical protein
MAGCSVAKTVEQKAVRRDAMLAAEMVELTVAE